MSCTGRSGIGEDAYDCKQSKIPYRENEIMDFCLSINKLEYLLCENLDTDLYKNIDKYIKIMEGEK